MSGSGGSFISGSGGSFQSAIASICLAICIFHHTDGTVVTIGNSAVPSTALVKGVPGLTIFVAAQVPSEGTLFAFRAYFVSNASMSVQVWRPYPGSPTYQLIVDIPLTPAVLQGTQDIYLSESTGGKCTLVKPGDQLAAYFPFSDTPLPYVFNPDTVNAHVLTYTVKDTSSPSGQGQVVTFDSLVFPYRFSMSGYIYKDDSAGAVAPSDQCPPPSVRIPVDYSTTTSQTTTLPRTAQPGYTGATGPMGPRGATGAVGKAGEMGSQGATGATGVIGYTGLAGPMGDTGDTGYTGVGGNRGATGQAGYTGAIGATGATGIEGPRGPPGLPAVSSQHTTPRSASIKDGDRMEDWWRRRSLVTGLYIWLAILSFLALVILVWSVTLCAVYCCNKSDLETASRKYVSYINAYNEANYYDGK